ncbi:MAG: response regulator [Nitratireductor sp.]|nr:response regulator [Nitratireductor sp.]
MIARQIALGTASESDAEATVVAENLPQEVSGKEAWAEAAETEELGDTMPYEEAEAVTASTETPDDTQMPEGESAAQMPADEIVVDGDAGYDILVCEDNEVNQIVFSQILLSTPYRFHIANNGEEGVAAFRERASNPPKLILMDVSMPKMNGLEATSEIRHIEALTGGRIPIIGVTAHAIKGDEETCLKAGMDDYLSKPVSPEKLIAKIEQWISERQASEVA